MRNDVAVWTLEPVDDAAARELQRLPGVKAVEASRFVDVILVHGHRRERSLLRGYALRPELYRIVDVDRRETLPSGSGLVLTDRLADKLGVHVGDRVRVEVLEGRARTLDLVVDATVREMMGLNAYMDRAALNRALGDGDLSTGYVLSTAAPAARPRCWRRRKPDAARGRRLQQGDDAAQHARSISARNVRIMSTMLTLFATVIAVGVVYNNARIALAERTWELASLRVLGLHARRGLGAAARRDGDRRSRSRCRWAWCSAVASCTLMIDAAEVRPVLLSGGDPAAHLRLGRDLRRGGRRWPARWSCAGASTGSTWWRP